VFHADEECDGQSFGREFLVHRGSVKPFVQIVVFRGGKVGDGAETAVVIGQNQAVGGDHFGRTTAAENRNGVFERRMVDAVNFIGGQLQTVFLHVDVVQSFDKHRKPHPLVGLG